MRFATMQWNDATYSCHSGVLRQLNPYIPSWEQEPMTIYVSLRAFGSVGQDTYQCGYTDGTLKPAGGEPGRSLNETMMWNDEPFDCLWLGPAATCCRHSARPTSRYVAAHLMAAKRTATSVHSRRDGWRRRPMPTGLSA
jgi:hypothetical protein